MPIFPTGGWKYGHHREKALKKPDRTAGGRAAGASENHVFREATLESPPGRRGERYVIKDKLTTKQDLKELEYRLTIRFGSMIAAAVAILAALLALMK